jgi:hypothetical protein
MSDNKKRKEVPEPMELTQIQQAPAKKPRLDITTPKEKEKAAAPAMDMDYPSGQPVPHVTDLLFIGCAGHGKTRVFAFNGTEARCERVMNAVDLARKSLKAHKREESHLVDMFTALARDDDNAGMNTADDYVLNDITLECYTRIMSFTKHSDWYDYSGQDLFQYSWVNPYAVIPFKAD